jgi:hypothetical protein
MSGRAALIGRFPLQSDSRKLLNAILLTFNFRFAAANGH